MEEIDGLGISLRSLRLNVDGWQEVSAADKGCRVYPLGSRPDDVALYSGCTPGKRRAWFLPDDRHPASLFGLRGGGRHARTNVFTLTYGSNTAVPGSPKVNSLTPISQTYSQAAKCAPLTLLQSSSLPKPIISPSIPSVSASSAQADLLTSTPLIAAIISESPPVNPIPNKDSSTSNISAFPSNSGVRPSSASPSIQDTKQKAITRLKKEKRVN
ncbi:uncharacterized protein TNCV_3002351 [Trichonephila clavipes]|nr:uncharacterized protein TNCV_3002351 [Trichonephila clavipes]